ASRAEGGRRRRGRSRGGRAWPAGSSRPGASSVGRRCVWGPSGDVPCSGGMGPHTSTRPSAVITTRWGEAARTAGPAASSASRQVAPVTARRRVARSPAPIRTQKAAEARPRARSTRRRPLYRRRRDSRSGPRIVTPAGGGGSDARGTAREIVTVPSGRWRSPAAKAWVESEIARRRPPPSVSASTVRPRRRTSTRTAPGTNSPSAPCTPIDQPPTASTSVPQARSAIPSGVNGRGRTVTGRDVTGPFCPSGAFIGRGILSVDAPGAEPHWAPPPGRSDRLSDQLLLTAALDQLLWISCVGSVLAVHEFVAAPGEAVVEVSAAIHLQVAA